MFLFLAFLFCIHFACVAFGCYFKQQVSSFCCTMVGCFGLLSSMGLLTFLGKFLLLLLNVKQVLATILIGLVVQRVARDLNSVAAVVGGLSSVSMGGAAAVHSYGHATVLEVDVR